MSDEQPTTTTINKALVTAVDDIAERNGPSYDALTSFAEKYAPVGAGAPDSPARVIFSDSRTPSPLALALYQAVVLVAVQTDLQIGMPSKFSTAGNADFLNDLVDIANYERDTSGASTDSEIPLPRALRPGNSAYERLNAVFDHLTDTFIRLIMPIASTPGLSVESMMDSTNSIARARRAAREAAVLVLRHLAGADRAGTCVPTQAVGTSRICGGRSSSADTNGDLVHQTIQAIQQAASGYPVNAGIF